MFRPSMMGLVIRGRDAAAFFAPLGPGHHSVKGVQNADSRECEGAPCGFRRGPLQPLGAMCLARACRPAVIRGRQRSALRDVVPVQSTWDHGMQSPHPLPSGGIRARAPPSVLRYPGLEAGYQAGRGSHGTQGSPAPASALRHGIRKVIAPVSIVVATLPTNQTCC